MDTTQYLSAFNSDQDYTLPATVLCKSNDVSIRFLFDIGALQGNYISIDLAVMLEKQGIKRTKCSQRVCSAMTGLCKETRVKSVFIFYSTIYIRVDMKKYR